MKRIIKHNIKAAKLAWQETSTHRSKTLLQWDGPSIKEARALTIRHDFYFDSPASAGELALPRKVGRAASIPEQTATMAQLLDGAFVRGIEVDIVQTATGVQYRGYDAAGAPRGADVHGRGVQAEELMARGAAD